MTGRFAFVPPAPTTRLPPAAVEVSEPRVIVVEVPAFLSPRIWPPPALTVTFPRFWEVAKAPVLPLMLSVPPPSDTAFVLPTKSVGVAMLTLSSSNVPPFRLIPPEKVLLTEPFRVCVPLPILVRATKPVPLSTIFPVKDPLAVTPAPMDRVPVLLARLLVTVPPVAPPPVRRPLVSL